ncbi:MAG: hypothetical protein KF708_03100 [Pirellulales bacterium]|nr:hypothetical protein [Pirellulales bacterium]
MNKPLDVYRDWLGITETARPLSYYQILRLRQFEDDPAKIGTHYRKMNAHVRKFAAGDFAKQSQDLLNELAKAMLCLTDAHRKAEYDASLGRKDATPGKRRSMEELLLLRKVVDQEQLAKARRYAQAVGVDMHDALVQQKLATADVAMQIFAESQGLPYLDLSDIECDTFLLPKVPAVLARQHSCVPVMIDDDQLLVASPHPLKPEVEDELRLRVGMPVRSVLCTPAGVNNIIAQHYTKEAAAAEMAAGGAPAAGRKATNTSAVTAAAAGPLTAEQKKEFKKRRLMTTLMAFNFGFMAMIFWQQLLKGLFFNPLPSPFLTVTLPLAIGVGLVAAGAGFAYATVKG